MLTRRQWIVRVISVISLLGLARTSSAATYRTKNFIVYAANQQVAEIIGQDAERYRREKAMQWLGREMQPWGRPCPLRVTVHNNGSGGATSFVFDGGQILDQKMQIEGTLERLRASVLPHEITHTVFAYYYRTPVPRWADEGGSVLSEDQLERSRHDKLVRNLLRSRRAMPLRRLFSLKEYPRDVMTLYAQGYSVTHFLVSRSNRQHFLRFVAQGMRGNWDGAARQYYGFENVDALEEAWLQHLRQTPAQPATIVARENTDGGAPRARLGDEVIVRQTAPPMQPLLKMPGIARGQDSREEYQPYQPTSETRRPEGRSWNSPRGGSEERPRYSTPRATLGAPQFGPPPGYPR